MTSGIDANSPQDGGPSSKAEFRQFRNVVKNEIESLQTLACINVADHGILPENTASENATGLLALRQSLLTEQVANEETNFVLFFPPSSTPYQYDNNKWVRNILHLTIYGYGAIFQYTGGGNAPFNFGGLWSEEDVGESAINGTGSAIDTTVFGDSTVTLKSLAENSKFQQGTRVFIYGFDAQGGGFPPNARYFEFNQVEAVDVATGVITLKTPLRYQYRDDWPDLGTSSQGIGGGRIKSLDTVGGGWRFCEKFDLRGIRVFDASNASPLFVVARKFIAHDVQAVEAWPQSCESTVFNNCRFSGPVEVDKLGDTVTFLDCDFEDSLRLGSAFNKITAQRCTINCTSVSVGLSARHIKLDDNIIIGPPSAAFGFIGTQAWSVDNLEITNNRLINRSSGADGIISRDTTDVIVDAVGASKEIRIDKTNNFDPIKHPEIGMILYQKSTGLGGKITSFTEDATHWIITGSWPNTPVASDAWAWDRVSNMTNSGNHLLGAPTLDNRLERRPLLAFAGKTSELSVQNTEMDWPLISGSKSLEIYGFLREVEVTVLRPSTGGTSPTLNWLINHTGGTHTIVVDLSIVGTRKIGISSALGNDVLPDDMIDNWTTTSFVSISGGPDFVSPSLRIKVDGAIGQ